VENANVVDLTRIPRNSGETTNGVQCLIHEAATGNTQPDGQDTLNPYGAPSNYPFQIPAGTSHPLGAGFANSPISNGSSVVSSPIYDHTAATIASRTTTNVTFVRFRQVFINAVDANREVKVTC
jgi:hypothetical protein